MRGYALLLALLAAAPGMQGDQAEILASSHRVYVPAVSAYQECRDQEALDGGRSLSSDYLAWIWRRDLPLTVSAGWERLAAGVLLHARLAEESGAAETKLEHDRLAAHLSELLLAAQPPERVDQLAYALLAIQLQDLNRVGRLAQLLARMPLEYRGEPPTPALLATASLHELLSGPMVSLGAVVFESEPEGLPTDLPRLDAWGRTMADGAFRSKRANRDRAIVLLRHAGSPPSASSQIASCGCQAKRAYRKYFEGRANRIGRPRQADIYWAHVREGKSFDDLARQYKLAKQVISTVCRLYGQRRKKDTSGRA